MIMTIVRKEIQVLLKEKGTFFWLFLLPILFILMFSSIFGNMANTFTIKYYDGDKSPESTQLVDALSGIKGFVMKTDASVSMDDQLQKIRDGRETSLLVIPAGYGADLKSGSKQATLQFYRDAAADNAVAPIQAVLSNVSTQFLDVKLKGTLAALGQSPQQVETTMTPPLKVTETKENAAKVDAISQYVPGYTVMFVFFIIITMIRNFLKDRDSGMLARLRSTPMKPMQYLIGMWVPNILVVLVQCAVLLGFGKIVYDMQLGDSLALIAIVIGLAVCATGIGLALAMVVRSENQGVAFTQILTMGGAVLGGLWFPYDFMPKAAQAIGRVTPQYWAQHAFQDVMIRGAHIGDILMTILVLFAYAVAGLLIASLRFKRFLLGAKS